MTDLIQKEEHFGAHNYAPLPIVLVRGEGAYLYDEAGNRYLDMMSAYSAVSHGHCHPKLLAALVQQSKKLNVVSRAFYTDQLAPFLEKLCTLTGYEKALPMNSGAEAVETALKAARKWAYTVKKVPQDQAEVIVCSGNFHGRTIAIVGMSSEPQYQDGFGPFTGGVVTIPFGDAEALAKAITPNTAAFLVEPIQGEGGIIVPPKGYLKECAAICKNNQVLMICDEIQTGLGRTGKLLAAHHDEIQPDALVLGKALGGGIMAVSAFLCQKEVMDVFTPGDHGSTFGGNPLAASVGRAALDVLIDEHLIDRAETLGNFFMTQLNDIKSPAIKEVRGKGLLIGLELHGEYSARAMCLRLMKRGILTKETHHTTIRFAPPLVIEKESLVEALTVIKTEIEALRPTK